MSTLDDYSAALSRVNGAIDAADRWGILNYVAYGRVAVFKDTRDRIAVGWRQAMSPPINTELGLAALAAMQSLASDAEGALLDANGQPKATTLDDAGNVAVNTSQAISKTASDFANQFAGAIGTFTTIVEVGVGIAGAIALYWLGTKLFSDGEK